MSWNPLKDVKKVVKKVYDPVEDLTKGTLRATGKVVEEVYNPLEKGVREVGKGVENVGQEIDRNKNLIAGVVAAPFTAGASLVIAKDDDTTVGRELNKAWNEYGLKEAATTAALVAGTIYTGGALAGAAGAATTGMSALSSSAALTAVGTSAVQAQQGKRAAVKAEKAQAEYNRQVDEANRKALEERRSSLLKTKKQLVPNLTKSSQGGFAGSTEDIDIKLG